MRSILGWDESTLAFTPCPDAAGVIDARKASHARRRDKVKDRARRGLPPEHVDTIGGMGRSCCAPAARLLCEITSRIVRLFMNSNAALHASGGKGKRDRDLSRRWRSTAKRFARPGVTPKGEDAAGGFVAIAIARGVRTAGARPCPMPRVESWALNASTALRRTILWRCR
jgi:hypothetical protein